MIPSTEYNMESSGNKILRADTNGNDSEAHAESLGYLDWRIFLVVGIILTILIALLVLGMCIQWQDYHAGIKAALTDSVKDHAAILSYARAMDAAIVKTSGLFLGYLLVFTGALYVLRTASAAYQIALKAKGHAGTFKTSSPGLVIITLGVFLITVTIITKSDINYEAPSGVPSIISPAPDGEAVESQPTLPTTTPPSERKK